MKNFVTSVLGVVGVFGAMAIGLGALAFYTVAFEAHQPVHPNHSAAPAPSLRL